MAKASSAISGVGSGAASGAALGSIAGPGIGTAIGAGIGGIAGGIAGIAAGAEEEAQREKAEQLRQQALQLADSLNIPPVEALQIYYEKYSSAGELTPELEQVFTQADTELNKVSTDPALKTAQMSALQKLQQLGEEGLNFEDKVILDDLRRKTESEAKSQQASILQGAQQRGVADSGQHLAAQLSANQSQINRLSQQSDEQAAQIQKRMLDAISQSGALAGKLRSQEYEEKSAAAQAQDIINKFNTANKQDVSSSNVNRQNQAQQYNLNQAQRIADANVGLSNQQRQYNTGLLADDYERRLQQAKLKMGAYGTGASGYDTSADRSAQTFSGTMQGIGNVAQALGSGIKSMRSSPVVESDLSDEELVKMANKAKSKL